VLGAALWAVGKIHSKRTVPYTIVRRVKSRLSHAHGAHMNVAADRVQNMENVSAHC